MVSHQQLKPYGEPFLVTEFQEGLVRIASVIASKEKVYLAVDSAIVIPVLQRTTVNTVT